MVLASIKGSVTLHNSHCSPVDTCCTPVGTSVGCNYTLLVLLTYILLTQVLFFYYYSIPKCLSDHLCWILTSAIVYTVVEMLFLKVEIIFLIACMLKCAKGEKHEEQLKKVKSAEGREIIDKVVKNFNKEKARSYPVFNGDRFFTFNQNYINGIPLEVSGVKISELKLKDDIEVNPVKNTDEFIISINMNFDMKLNIDSAQYARRDLPFFANYKNCEIGMILEGKQFNLTIQNNPVKYCGFEIQFVIQGEED